MTLSATIRRLSSTDQKRRRRPLFVCATWSAATHPRPTSSIVSLIADGFSRPLPAHYRPAPHPGPGGLRRRLTKADRRTSIEPIGDLVQPSLDAGFVDAWRARDANAADKIIARLDWKPAWDGDDVRQRYLLADHRVPVSQPLRVRGVVEVRKLRAV